MEDVTAIKDKAEQETKVKRSKTKITKNEVILIIVFGFVFVFNFFLFNQMDVIFVNQGNFGFTVGEVIWGFILSGFVIFVVLTYVLLVLVEYAKRAFKITLAILFGFMLASYFQVLFLNGNYVSDMHPYTAGHQPWGAGMQVLSMLIWIAILLLPLCIIYADRLPKIKNILKKDIFFRAIIFGSAIVFTMQGIGLIAASRDVGEKSANQLFYFSATQVLNLSESENIVVFLIDRWPIWLTDNMFVEHPHMLDFFHGFTFYRNALSVYPQTFPGLPALLGGTCFYTFVGESGEGTRRDFSRYSWDNATLYDELASHGWSRIGLLDAASTYFDVDEVVPHFDNIVFPDESARDVNSILAIWAMAGFTLQRILPYPMKNMIHTGFPNSIRNVVSTDSPDYFPNGIWRHADPYLYRRLDAIGLSTSPGNTFSFIHMNGPHSLEIMPAMYDVFNFLNAYFQEMKRLDIFDNSTIILMSDHGGPGNRYEVGQKPRFSTSLLIKESGAPHVPLQINTDIPWSNTNFVPTIMELVTGVPQDNSFFDIRDRNVRPNRYISFSSWNVSNHASISGRTLVDPLWVPATPWPFTWCSSTNNWIR
ncbi:MAG: hypothetical protein FWE16_02225 [Firmicutes bacterium]|nr:hypothetical protein [Bacillota bacterium]